MKGKRVRHDELIRVRGYLYIASMWAPVAEEKAKENFGEVLTNMLLRAPPLVPVGQLGTEIIPPESPDTKREYNLVELMEEEK